MADDIVTRLRAHLVKRDVTSRTHWDGCIDSHPICALAWALDEIERLRAEVDGKRHDISELIAQIVRRDDEIVRLRAAGDAMAVALSRHHMACGVKDAWDRLAAWQEARREQ